MACAARARQLTGRCAREWWRRFSDPYAIPLAEDPWIFRTNAALFWVRFAVAVWLFVAFLPTRLNRIRFEAPPSEDAIPSALHSSNASASASADPSPSPPPYPYPYPYPYTYTIEPGCANASLNALIVASARPPQDAFRGGCSSNGLSAEDYNAHATWAAHLVMSLIPQLFAGFGFAFALATTRCFTAAAVEQVLQYPALATSAITALGTYVWGVLATYDDPHTIAWLCRPLEATRNGIGIRAFDSKRLPLDGHVEVSEAATLDVVGWFNRSRFSEADTAACSGVTWDDYHLRVQIVPNPDVVTRFRAFQSEWRTERTTLMWLTALLLVAVPFPAPWCVNPLVRRAGRLWRRVRRALRRCCSRCGRGRDAARGQYAQLNANAHANVHAAAAAAADDVSSDDDDADDDSDSDSDREMANVTDPAAAERARRRAERDALATEKRAKRQPRDALCQCCVKLALSAAAYDTGLRPELQDIVCRYLLVHAHTEDVRLLSCPTDAQAAAADAAADADADAVAAYARMFAPAATSASQAPTTSAVVGSAGAARRRKSY